jgi:heme-degrading monooxygenase HmoA
VIVVSNCVPVAGGHEGELAERFRTRAHLVGHYPGFVRLGIGRPGPVAFHGEPVGASPSHVVLASWESTAHFPAWVQREAFRAWQLVAETLGVPAVATNRVGLSRGAWGVAGRSCWRTTGR